ncbi:MAG TPA: hypothetical protein VKA60_11570 [Blastocatellia bacterium]|nr:hypothetical protein [Blastocatellia bacterium]
MFDQPFRWNITNQIYLGSLVQGEKANAYKGFSEQILHCCSRVLAFAGDSDLTFVGRSPESIFDHLSGLLFDTSWFDRLELLQFSMRFFDEGEIREKHPNAIDAMRAYLDQLRLSPQALAERPRPVAFIDLVASGDTFSRLIMLLYKWARGIQLDWGAVSRKIRLVGITERTKTSPKTWRWQQHADWVSLLQRGAIKNVSIPADLWRYLGNYQLKVTRSYTPARWGSPDATKPEYSEEQLKALRLAYELFEQGKTRERREELASVMVEEPAMKHRWYRALVQEIRT